MAPLPNITTGIIILVFVSSVYANQSQAIDSDSIPDTTWAQVLKSARLLLEAAEERNPYKLAKGTRDLVQAGPKGDMKFAGIDMQTLELKYGTLHYWDGHISKFSGSPLWTRVKDTPHFLSKKSVSGIAFVEEIEGTPNFQGADFTPKRLSTPEIKGTVRIFTLDNSEWGIPKADDTTCKNMALIIDDLKDRIDQLDNGVILLNRKFYCPEMFDGLITHFYKLRVGSTYTSDGDLISYIKDAEKVKTPTVSKSRKEWLVQQQQVFR
nr:hypothetical protein [Amarillovirales sp.]